MIFVRFIKLNLIMSIAFGDDWQLIQTFMDDPSDEKQWPQITNQVSLCNQKQIQGGYNIYGKGADLTSTENLPPHFKVNITLDFYVIDSWDPQEAIIIKIDGNEKYNNKPGRGSSKLCGAYGWDDQIVHIEIIDDHIKPQILIKFTTTLNQNADDESWGIRNLRIYILPCQRSNYYTLNDWCCNEGISPQLKQCLCPDGQYVENNLCNNCQQPCAFCSKQKNNCTKCEGNLTLAGNKCTCQDQYFLKDNNCFQCDKSCNTCHLESTTCISCRGQLQIQINNTCHCPGNQSLLSIEDGTCECDEGYFLKGESCYPCKPPCKNCKSEQICTTCIGDFVEQNDACVCKGNLSRFENPLLFCSCQEHYFQSGDQCYECDINCKLCVGSKSNCSQCYQNSRLDEQNNQCVCVKGYQKNETIQDQHFYKFDFDSQYCIKNQTFCGPYCQKCDIDSQLCSTCDEGYKLNKTICANMTIDCPKNCSKCFENGTCYKCHTNYTFFNGSCQYCLDGSIQSDGACYKSNESACSNFSKCPDKKYSICITGLKTNISQTDIKLPDAESSEMVITFQFLHPLSFKGYKQIDFSYQNLSNFTIQTKQVKKKHKIFGVKIILTPQTIQKQFCLDISYPNGSIIDPISIPILTTPAVSLSPEGKKLISGLNSVNKDLNNTQLLRFLEMFGDLVQFIKRCNLNLIIAHKQSVNFNSQTSPPSCKFIVLNELQPPQPSTKKSLIGRCFPQYVQHMIQQFSRQIYPLLKFLDIDDEVSKYLRYERVEFTPYLIQNLDMGFFTVASVFILIIIFKLLCFNVTQKTACSFQTMKSIIEQSKKDKTISQNQNLIKLIQTDQTINPFLSNFYSIFQFTSLQYYEGKFCVFSNTICLFILLQSYDGTKVNLINIFSIYIFVGFSLIYLYLSSQNLIIWRKSSLVNDIQFEELNADYFLKEYARFLLINRLKQRLKFFVQGLQLRYFLCSLLGVFSILKKWVFAAILVYLYGYVKEQIALLFTLHLLFLILILATRPYEKFIYTCFGVVHYVLACAILALKMADNKAIDDIQSSNEPSEDQAQAWINQGWITLTFEVSYLGFSIIKLFATFILLFVDIVQHQRKNKILQNKFKNMYLQTPQQLPVFEIQNISFPPMVTYNSDLSREENVLQKLEKERCALITHQASKHEQNDNQDQYEQTPLNLDDDSYKLSTLFKEFEIIIDGYKFKFENILFLENYHYFTKIIDPPNTQYIISAKQSGSPIDKAQAINSFTQINYKLVSFLIVKISLPYQQEKLIQLCSDECLLIEVIKSNNQNPQFKGYPSEVSKIDSNLSRLKQYLKQVCNLVVILEGKMQINLDVSFKGEQNIGQISFRLDEDGPKIILYLASERKRWFCYPVLNKYFSILKSYLN